MIKYFIYSVLLFLGLLFNAIGQVNNDNNPLLADPSIFYYKGVYYLYGTGGGSKDGGFKVFTSADKINWKDKGFALRKGESYGSKGFWAPQVFEYKQKFYMAYTANEHIAIAVANSPLGPFTQQEKKALEVPVRMIDPFVYFDASGKIYLYHVRLQNGNRIFVAELDNSLSSIKESTLQECISASARWEDTQNASWKVTEGPTVLKHRGLYYLIYSANDFRNPDYAIGYAISENHSGPWKKYEGNPVISTKILGVNGTGHGDVVSDKKGNLFYVFHIHNTNNNVAPRKTAIIQLKFKKKKGAPDEIVAIPGTYQLLEKTIE